MSTLPVLFFSSESEIPPFDFAQRGVRGGRGEMTSGRLVRSVRQGAFAKSHLNYAFCFCAHLCQLTSSGDAIKIEEYVPTTIPTIIASTKFCVEVPPKM